MFDARSVRSLAAGEHLNIGGYPGLRIARTAQRFNWVYRYKSPVDGRMRQTKLGQWPELPLPQAVKKWERARRTRSAGTDLAVEKRAARAEERAAVDQAKLVAYTCRQVCNEYL